MRHYVCEQDLKLPLIRTLTVLWFYNNRMWVLFRIGAFIDKKTFEGRGGAYSKTGPYWKEGAKSNHHHLWALVSAILSDPMSRNVPRSPCRNDHCHLGLERTPHILQDKSDNARIPLHWRTKELQFHEWKWEPSPLARWQANTRKSMRLLSEK